MAQTSKQSKFSPIGRMSGDVFNQLELEWVLQGQPAQTWRSNMSIMVGAGSVNTAISATGVGLGVAVPLLQGDVITNISYITATTAAGTPTHQYVALYDPNLNLLATSGDLTSTARAANTAYTIPLLTQVTIPSPGNYYVSTSFTATTVPTLYGITAANNILTQATITGQALLTFQHGSALAGVAPATIAFGGFVAKIPWFILT